MLLWPEKNFSSRQDYQAGNGDKRLFDDIVDFLMDKKLGFTGGCEDKQVTEDTEDSQKTVRRSH